ncbi:MAG TPA: rhamnan synthesis F family protein [bacterium]|nr:rhamnan synthesis F family protein [bacterium]
MKSFRYREFLKHSLLRRSSVLSSLHFCLRGYDQVIRGDRRLAFKINGQYYEYVELVYLKANPDVREKIKNKQIPDGLSHFLKVGYREILDKKRQYAVDVSMPKVFKITKNPSSKKRKHLCLFAHFDPQGLIDPYVILYLETLKSIGCDIVFVTETAQKKELKKLVQLCFRVIQRSAGGLDFGSWYSALTFLKLNLNAYDTVILANDSAYFPIRPVDQLLEKMRKFDFWGITESLQKSSARNSYHIQSYFLGFSKSARKKGLLNQFLSQYEKYPVLSKCGIIEIFEYGMTQWAFNSKLKVGALCNLRKCYEYTKKIRKLPNLDRITPTLDLWDTLIDIEHCPILKVGLVRDNPKDNFDFSLAKKPLRLSNYPVQFIRKHIKRITKK